LERVPIVAEAPLPKFRAVAVSPSVEAVVRVEREEAVIVDPAKVTFPPFEIVNFSLPEALAERIGPIPSWLIVTAERPEDVAIIPNSSLISTAPGIVEMLPPVSLLFKIGL
jgi:hypothetical protein